MAEVTRTQLIEAVQNWRGLVEEFQRRPLPQQMSYLEKQGYARLGDLLGHVIAWWEEGLPAVKRKLVEPGYQSPDVDVDCFNASAVQRFRFIPEYEIVEKFDTLRAEWLDLINSLPEEAFHESGIAFRLHIELIGHLEEHAIFTKPAG